MEINERKKRKESAKKFYKLKKKKMKEGSGRKTQTFSLVAQ